MQNDDSPRFPDIVLRQTSRQIKWHWILWTWGTVDSLISCRREISEFARKVIFYRGRKRSFEWPRAHPFGMRLGCDLGKKEIAISPVRRRVVVSRRLHDPAKSHLLINLPTKRRRPMQNRNALSYAHRLFAYWCRDRTRLAYKRERVRSGTLKRRDT